MTGSNSLQEWMCVSLFPRWNVIGLIADRHFVSLRHWFSLWGGVATPALNAIRFIPSAWTSMTETVLFLSSFFSQQKTMTGFLAHEFHKCEIEKTVEVFWDPWLVETCWQLESFASVFFLFLLFSRKKKDRSRRKEKKNMWEDLTSHKIAGSKTHPRRFCRKKLRGVN